LISELETLAPRLARYELVREEPAPPATPDMALLPLLSDVLRERDPAGTPFPVLLPGYTDARHFARLGVQTYGFLPLKLSRRRSEDLSHAPDERIPLGAVQFGVECLSDAIRRYSG
jgi:acetylornithine deacetylase/succinyl-diaminopimelate desuccinylase-like protein